VDVPAGSHRVEWTFAPASLRHGALVSLLALLAVAGVACRPLRRVGARRV
jgi:hypothetical protein